MFGEDDPELNPHELTLPSEAELTRPVQHRIHSEQMRQAKLTFNAAMTIGFIGTIVLLVGIGSSFFDIGRGVSATAAGIVLDTLSFFAIKFHRETNQRLDEIRRD